MIYVEKNEIKKKCIKCRYCLPIRRQDGYRCAFTMDLVGHMKKDFRKAETRLESCPLKSIEEYEVENKRVIEEEAKEYVKEKLLKYCDNRKERGNTSITIDKLEEKISSIK